MTNFVFGLILVLIGISALLGFSFFKLIFSLLIIAIGIKLLMRGKKNNKCNWSKSTTSSSENYINEVVIFGPLNKNIKSEDLKGGKIVLIFAGGEIDLRNSKTSEKEINLEIGVVFGGVKLIVPKNWKINSQGTAIFGGYDNKVGEGSYDVVLNIKGSVVFGGIEIKN